MPTLTHFRLCPFSRSIRIALAEVGATFELAEERPWEWRAGFLALNPAGDLPVLQMNGGLVLCGAYSISEFWAEQHRHDAEPRAISLFPGTPEDRAEVRRLVDWFHRKLDREVTGELMVERVYPLMKSTPGHIPDPAVLRAVRANLAHHLAYLEFLADQRRCLAGDELSFADMAATAHMSCLDYLGEVPWDRYPRVREWYARMKSRRSVRAVLDDRIPGLAPPPHYTDPDF